MLLFIYASFKIDYLNVVSRDALYTQWNKLRKSKYHIRCSDYDSVIIHNINIKVKL